MWLILSVDRHKLPADYVRKVGDDPSNDLSGLVVLAATLSRCTDAVYDTQMSLILSGLFSVIARVLKPESHIKKSTKIQLSTKK